MTFWFFFFVSQISREPLNGFAPNLKGDVFGPLLERVWMSRSKVKVTKDKKCTVHSCHPPAVTEWNALAANNVMRLQKGPFHCCRGWFWRHACGLFGKTSFHVTYCQPGPVCWNNMYYLLN